MTVASISISTIVALVGVIIYVYVQSISDSVLIRTQYGQIQGFKMVSRGGRRFSAFRSIPYAKPPLGERRFQAPEEYGSWSGVHDGTVSIPNCLQADAIFKKLKGQEDCLILNVYTPNVHSDPNTVGEELLPVMVFFHGGHWMHGSSEMYGPQYFMDEEVVLVTVNYRLGAFGFLNTGDDEVTGNMGLKDQVLALKWVQKTIKDFGGDPNLVTIFGESAGGAIAELHTLSPMSKGLFHRSISMSGTSLCPWAISTKTRAAAEALGKQVNCTQAVGNTKELVKCLRTVDAWAIVEAHKATFDIFHHSSSIFGPSIEKGSDKSKAFLVEHPRAILTSERQMKVPRMLGVTSHEGCYRSAALTENEIAIARLQANKDTEYKKLLPGLLVYDNNEKERPDAAEKILQHYFGTSKFTPQLFSASRYEELTQMFSDRYFFKCTTDSAVFHAQLGPDSPVWLYFLSPQTKAFAFGDAIAASAKGSPHLPVLANAGLAYLKKAVHLALGWETFDHGVCHADDVMYLFHLHPLFDISIGSERYELSRTMVKVWVAFARDGHPGKFKGIEWKRMDPKDKQLDFMAINNKPGMIKEPFTKGRKFWESLGLEN